MKINNKIIRLKRYTKLLFHCERSAVILFALVLVLSFSLVTVVPAMAEDESIVTLSVEPTTGTSVSVGDTFSLEVWARFSVGGHSWNAADVIFQWDPTCLQLDGGASFPGHPINTTWDDGDAAIAYGGGPFTEDICMVTLNFTALASTSSTTFNIVRNATAFPSNPSTMVIEPGTFEDISGTYYGAEIEIVPPSEVWVDGVNGDDSTLGTEAEPFATIQKGIAEVAEGGTVNVETGTYFETIDITKDNLTIQSVSGNPEDTIIDANGADENVVDIIGRSGVTISGFTIKDAVGEAYISGVYMENVSGCSLSNSVIIAINTSGNSAYGILLENATDNDFSSISISDITGPHNTYGALITLDSDGNSFTSTTVSDIQGAFATGVKLDESSDGNSFETTTISNLTATEDQSFGIILSDSSKNNSFTDTEISSLTGVCGSFGIRLREGSDNNTFTSTIISHLTDLKQAFGIWIGVGGGQGTFDNVFESTEISNITATGGGAPVLGMGVIICSYSARNSFHTITISTITGDTSGEAIYLYDDASDNLFSDYEISDLAGGLPWGIYIREAASGNSFIDGSITGAQIGVRAVGDGGNNSIHFTNIAGNTEYGVKNTGTGTVDATNNWWGAASGPTHASNPDGTGDAVSDNVDYNPWYTDEEKTTLSNAIATLSDLTIDGTTISGFDSSTLIYNKTLPFGTTVIPIVAATTTDPNATTEITQATNLTGTEAERTATVVVTAEDGTTTKTYKVIFGSIKVTITKTGPTTANQGNNITYTITYKNEGTFDATNVVITETYPSEVEFVSATPAPDSGFNNKWTIGTLAPGVEGIITVTVHIK